MKKLVISLIASVIFCSCSKSITLVDNVSHQTKTIKGRSVIITNTDLNFESVKGTHYHISLAKYDAIIK